MFRKRKPPEPIAEAPPIVVSVPEPVDDDPEPPKLDSNGHISRAWTRWEWLQAEKRQRASRQPTLRERRLVAIDAQIAQAQDLVEDAARQKLAIGRLLREAHASGGNHLMEGGAVKTTRKGGPTIAELEKQMAEARDQLARAKSLEVDLRRQRNVVAGQRTSFQMADYLPEHLLG